MRPSWCFHTASVLAACTRHIIKGQQLPAQAVPHCTHELILLKRFEVEIPKAAYTPVQNSTLQRLRLVYPSGGLSLFAPDTSCRDSNCQLRQCHTVVIQATISTTSTINQHFTSASTINNHHQQSTINRVSDALPWHAGEAMDRWRNSLIDDEVVQTYSGKPATCTTGHCQVPTPMSHGGYIINCSWASASCTLQANCRCAAFLGLLSSVDHRILGITSKAVPQC